MEKPTIQDVARSAQVSLATVDRVLNNRGGVAAKSVLKVEAAIARLGYVRDEAAAALSRGRSYRYVFIVPSGDTGFAASLRREVLKEQTRLAAERVVLDLVTVPPFDVAAQVAALAGLGDADGVAVMATEASEIQDEVARLRDAGMHVVTLVADLPRSGRDVYVGPDNARAGRTAAEFMGRFVGRSHGRILLVAGSLAARDHSERVMGFRAVLRDRFPDLTLLPVVESFDDSARLSALVSHELAQGPLAGVYVSAAGTRGLIDAVTDAEVRPISIVHELTPACRSALRMGYLDLVLDQNPAAEVVQAVRLLRDLSARRALPPEAGDITMNIFVRENV